MITGARCRDRTYDIRRVKADDSSDINHLGSTKRIKTGLLGVPRSTSGAHALTDYQVTQIRTQRLTDSYWSRKLHVRTSTIRDARIGKRYQHVITPPDIAPRDGTGRGGTLNPHARPAKVRRSWEW